jgi:hypothetical protein
MLVFSRNIEQLNREDNVKLHFLNKLDAEKKKSFIQNHLQLMQQIYSECQKTLNELLSQTFLDETLKSLYSDQTSYTDAEKGEAYKHVAANLKLIQPIMDKMSKALNDPSSVSKLDDAEKSLLSRKNTLSDDLSDDERSARSSTYNKVKSQKTRIFWFAFGIVAITLACAAIVVTTAIFAPPLIAGVVGFFAILLAINGVVAMSCGIHEARVKYKALTSPNITQPTKKLDNEPALSLSGKMRGFIKKIRDQFKQPGLSSTQQSTLKQKESAFFDKNKETEKTQDATDQVKKEPPAY